LSLKLITVNRIFMSNPPENTGTPPDGPRPRIGEMLVEEGVISHAQVEEALGMQERGGGKIIENLIALGYLDPKAFANFLSRQPGMASINLLNYSIPDEIIKLVPSEFALKHEILPLDKLGRDLTVGMACPLDKATLDKLQSITGLRVKPFLVSMGDIRVALKRYYHAPDGPMAAYEEKPSITRPSLPSPHASKPEESARADAIKKAESGLHFEGIIGLVRKIHTLPALPETVSRVRAAMDDPGSTAADVAAVLSRDPALVAKVISLANSAAYGFPHRVDNIEMATRLLGLREIYSVVLASSVIDYFSKAKTFDYKAYWRRAMISATSARIVAVYMGSARRAGSSQRDCCTTSGVWCSQRWLANATER
jgi:hypothetical protein